MHVDHPHSYASYHSYSHIYLHTSPPQPHVNNHCTSHSRNSISFIVHAPQPQPRPHFSLAPCSSLSASYSPQPQQPPLMSYARCLATLLTRLSATSTYVMCSQLRSTSCLVNPQPPLVVCSTTSTVSHTSAHVLAATFASIEDTARWRPLGQDHHACLGLFCLHGETEAVYLVRSRPCTFTDAFASIVSHAKSCCACCP